MSEAEPMAQLEIHKGPDADLRVGGLRFKACRREVGEIDGGITLYVFGHAEATSEEIELVRMDLFRARPHYHAPAERQEESRIDAGDAIEWGIEAWTQRAPELAVDTIVYAESACLADVCV